MRNYVILFVAMLLCGCSPTIESVKQVQISAKSCCNDFSQFSFENLASTSEYVYFDVNTESQYFDFQSGGSYFKAFKIQSTGLQKKSVILRSYIQTLGFGRENYFFQPAVLLLDGRFNLIKKFDTKSDLVRNDLFSSGDCVLEKSIELSGDEQYIVVYTTKELLDYKTPYEFNQETYAAGVVLSSSGTTFFPSGPVGKLRIQIK